MPPILSNSRPFLPLQLKRLSLRDRVQPVNLSRLGEACGIAEENG